MTHAGLRRIVVSPVGRRRYVELLYRHLLAQRDSLDEWHLWLNTCDEQDICYLRTLAARHPEWIIIQESRVRPDGIFTIHTFFPECADPACVYLRLDDDVVWLQAGFLDEMFGFRQNNRGHFLVYANIINNSIISHMQQRMGNIDMRHGYIHYDSFDPVGLKDSKFAEYLHRSFIRAVQDGSDRKWRFDTWILRRFERVSINCISWLGSEFAKFHGRVGGDEENWLSCHKPSEMNVANAINGRALCAHFAFGAQRDHLDRTDVLERYREICPA